MVANRSLQGFFLVLIVACLSVQTGLAQTTAFTYQGKLTDNGAPASGPYQMQFKLFDSLGGAGQIGPTILDVPVTATQGVLTVLLDFGSSPFSGPGRWLEIAVRHNAGESYSTLSPREQIASSPFAIRTLSAASADSLSASCVGCVHDANIQSIAGRLNTYRAASAST